MFNLSWLAPGKIAGTIKVTKPVRKLGSFQDVEGTIWDVRGIIGDCILACKRTELHPYYMDTSGRPYYGLITQEWRAYYTEVVDNE